jgi:ssDNA-binding Zn-finger/Zn-ribbon topoisomerase 1
VPEACPACGAPFLVEKRSKAGVTLVCIKDGCEYVRDATESTVGAQVPDVK